MSPQTTRDVALAWRERSAAAGRLDQAIAEFREAVRLAPTFLDGRIDLANALLANGEASEAAVECREVLQQNPDAVQAIMILTAALTAEGQVDEAIASLERASQLDPGNADTHFRLGLALYDRGRSQGALAHLNEAIQLQPDDVPILWQTAWILATSPDPRVAMECGRSNWPVGRSSGRVARRAARLRCARRRAGRNRGFLRGQRGIGACGDDGARTRRHRVGQRDRPADAPLPPGLALSPAAIGRSGRASTAGRG